MSKPNWAFDENGNLRKELYQCSPTELDEKQAELAANPNPEWCKEYITKSTKGIQALEPGDTIYVKLHYSVASKFNGRMTFICFHGIDGYGPAMFCRTDDKLGGFVGVHMLFDKENPTLRSKEPAGVEDGK